MCCNSALAPCRPRGPWNGAHELHVDSVCRGAVPVMGVIDAAVLLRREQLCPASGNASHKRRTG
jgi:hypothetical protein